MHRRNNTRALRARAFMFTVNFSHVHGDVQPGLLCPKDMEPVSYMIYQEEIGEGGTYHYQGYLETSTRTTINILKGLEGLERAHFESRKGTQAQAVEYCSKPG